MALILLIEDNKEISETTCELLEMAGYDVITAFSGSEGVESAKSCWPNLILCDIWLPKKDGYEVLSELKQDQKLVDTPFIFFTACAEPREIKKGMEMGANGYICKPFSEEELLKQVELILPQMKGIK